MYEYTSLLFTIFFGANGVVSSSISSPCKIADISCLEKIMNDIRPKVFAGYPELGIESSDPLFIEEIVGEFPGFRYKFYNNYLDGLSNCDISNLKIHDTFKVQVDLNCPKLGMTGKYDLRGHIMEKPAEGNGDYIFVTEGYFINVEAELKKGDVNDGKTHIYFKDFKLDMAPKGPVNYEFANLFNEQTDLVDAFMKYKKENSEEITKSVQRPILYAAFKNFFNNFNKHLEIIALEDLVVDFK